MLIKDWDLNINYNRGDIICIDKKYYICALEHISGMLINPKNSEEIYWIHIKELEQLPTSMNFQEGIIISNDIETIINSLMSNVSNSTNKNITQVEKIEKTKKEKNLKRKISKIDDDIELFRKKRKMEESTLCIEDQIKLLNVSLETKLFLLDKHDSLQKSGSSDYAKGKTWLKTALNIPFGKLKTFPVKNGDSIEKITEYFKKVRKHLDSKVHNLDYVKDEIMEYLARKITNPSSKGHILALAGSPGVGKSVLLKALGEALDLPFYQINFGGLNDVSILTGHSETYIGSKPGKFVEFLQNSGCMNPIIYCDEIDKVSSGKEQEINGILTHILDEEQNSKFQDNYLSNIPIDLSKVFFVIAFNDFEKIDRIVSDRLKVIYINSPTIEDKIKIAKDKMIPDIINSFNFKKDKYINLNDDLLSYIIINKVPKEEGVRQLRKCLEKIFSKLNYYVLTGEYSQHTEYFKIDLNDKAMECINIRRNFINKCLDENNQKDNTSHMMMYV